MNPFHDKPSPADRDLIATDNIELAEQDNSYGYTADTETGRESTLRPLETKRARDESTNPLMKSASSQSISHVTEEENLPLGQAIRQYPKVVAYCLSLTVVIIGWGYALVIVGAIVAVEPFQKDYGEVYEGKLIIPSLWVSLWSASIPLGMAIGSVFAGWYQDRVGRKWSLRTGAIICAVGVAGIFFSYLPTNMNAMRAMFFVGKTIQGLSIGILKVTAMTYISETAPTALRGSAMGLVPTGNLIGQLLGSIVVYVVNDVPTKAGYLASFGSQWILAVIPFILSLIIPESPAYLEERGESEMAVEASRKLYAPRVDALKVLERVRASIAEEKEMTAGANYFTCFEGTNRRRTMIVVMANLFPALFGLDLISKSSYFLQTIGMKSSISLMILIGGIVAGTFANGLGLWILSRVGRRKVTLISLSISTVLWVAVGISGIWKGPAVAYFTAGGCILIIVVCGMSVWPASYAIMGETSSLRLRAKTQGIGGVAQQGSSVVMSIVLPYAYNPDAGHLGAKTGFIYVGLCALGVALCWFFLPEMKGRNVMEIDHMFNLRLPARKFEKWRGDVDSK
ncbi:maltose permease [Colletotrichum tofieldiae]|uniref:Maltose permease n=1 Tax=Colletotrichum tofieldiae TaxID=708197 RepID=A0A161VY52_9PEZI|nr:maltose permease [Colletotrichum tofieldiae]GKT67016.1 maltose permease [Colletotrichum tofieldiae]GKT80384.1 maltose permease [Colletotrichum tofieldiae]